MLDDKENQYLIVRSGESLGEVPSSFFLFLFQDSNVFATYLQFILRT